MQHKIIFVVFDGMGDRPIKELGDKTPLEAAHAPNLDQLAKLAINGLNHSVARSVRPGSDVSHLSLFGYDPKIYYTGRGIFEAAGLNMDLQNGDVALRANVATVDENMTILDRRAGRIDNVDALAQLIDGLAIDGVHISAKAGVGHRMAVVLHGKSLSHQISDVDPHEPNVKVLNSKATDASKNAAFTAEVVNKLVKKAHELFSKQPVANALLLRGAGIISDIPSFKTKYDLTACCVAGGGLYKGIARMLGMDVLQIEGATGKPDTNIANKVTTTMEGLKTHDFVFLHLKGTDSCAEDGNYLGKKEYLERADKEFSPFVEFVNSGKGVVVVTGDHSTSSRLKAHTADPIPILIAGADVRVDKVQTFSERAAAAGALGHIRGLEIMPFLMDLFGNQPLYGN